MRAGQAARLFLDSNVITGGIIAVWGLDKAVLSVCAARVCRLSLAAAVHEEVLDNIRHRKNPDEVRLLETTYLRFLKLARPQVVPYPSEDAIRSHRHLIRHGPDVPVLLSAIAAKPDWLLTNNTRHFNGTVASRTGLRIATPKEFFRALSEAIV